MEILYPDYENSALGTVNAILSHYGAQTRHAPLSMLQDRLKTAGRNVVFLVLDALGLEVLERHARPEGFFRSHLMGALSPVFPCTTVADVYKRQGPCSPWRPPAAQRAGRFPGPPGRRPRRKPGRCARCRCRLPW